MAQPVFIPNGVAQYPFSTPFIGQHDLFSRLSAELQNHLSAGVAPNIMVMKGPWGSGKSRLGFEVCSQLLTTSRGWITERTHDPVPLIPPLDSQKYLPLYLRYVDVLDYSIDPTNVLPLCFLKAVQQVCDVASEITSRDRLQTDCKKRLVDAGVDVATLRSRLSNVSEDNALQLTQEVAQLLANSFGRILLVIDEVETANELPPDDIPDDMDDADRKAERDDIVILAQGCKEIANENVAPGVDYLLLASDPSYGSFTSGALQSARITTLGFQPVTFDQIDILRSAYKDYSVSFPEHLEEAAFFVSNRNFRWYNWLMFRLHSSYERQSAATHWELLERESKNVGGRGEIFDLDELETFMTGKTAVDEKLKQIVFAMIPTPRSAIGDDVQAAMVEQNQNQRAVSVLLGAKLSASELASELRSRQFMGSGNHLERGGVTVEVTKLLSAFELFGGSSECFYFYKDAGEFVQQVMLLYPDIDDASICRDLHQILLGRYSAQDGMEAYGPSMELLARLNRKWKTPKETAFLSNPEKNLRLSEARDEFKPLSPTAKRQHLSSGLANLVFEEHWKPKDKPAREEVKLATGIMADVSAVGRSQEAWQLSPFQVVAVLVADSDTASLVKDLKTIRSKVGLCPVILLIENRERYEQLDSEDKPFHEGEVYPRDLVIEVDLSQASADYEICANFGYARGVVFGFYDLSPGRWAHRSQSLRKRVPEEWEARLRKAEDQGWVMKPIYQKKDADKLVQYIEAVIRGEDEDDIRNNIPESDNAKRDYDEHKSHLEPIFDDQDHPVLTPSQLSLIRKMYGEVDHSSASALLKEMLYQGYLKVTAAEALKQNLDYLTSRGIVRISESNQKYRRVAPHDLGASLDEGERTITEYKAKRDELKSFFEGTLNSFHMQDADIDPLLQQLEGHRKVLKTKYQGDIADWNSQLLEDYTGFCSQCRRTLTQISDPSATHAFPDITTEIIGEALPKLTSDTMALESNVAHRVRFLTQYQSEFEAKRKAVEAKASACQQQIQDKLRPAHPAFPWEVVEDAISNMLDDLAKIESSEAFELTSPELSVNDSFPRFSLRKLVTESRLKDAFARIVRYNENLLETSEGLWKRAIDLVTKWEKETKPLAERALNRWDELNGYLNDAGTYRKFLDDRQDDRDSINSAVAAIPMKAGTSGLVAVEDALDTLQRAAVRLEDDVKAERTRLDGGLITGIADIKGVRTLVKISDRAKALGKAANITTPETIAQQSNLLFKDKKQRINDLIAEVDAKGTDIVVQFTGASREDWAVYKKVVSSLYREEAEHGYDFGGDYQDGLVDEQVISHLQDIGLLHAERKWKIEP